MTYDELLKETRAEMERLGRLQGVNPAEVEQQHDDAQVAIHGNVSPYEDNDILMRGFKRRKGA